MTKNTYTVEKTHDELLKSVVKCNGEPVAYTHDDHYSHLVKLGLEMVDAIKKRDLADYHG